MAKGRGQSKGAVIGRHRRRGLEHDACRRKQGGTMVKLSMDWEKVGGEEPMAREREHVWGG